MSNIKYSEVDSDVRVTKIENLVPNSSPINTIRIIAREDLQVFPYSWTKGLDYELAQHDGYCRLATNEGSINYSNDVIEEVIESFKIKVPVEN